MNNHEKLKEEIITQYGNIKRARGSYLYTAKGVRLVDMYQEAGRAILGWGSGNSKSMQMMKNAIDRGLTGSFPTDYENQLKRAVLQIFPDYSHVRWYHSRQSLGTALSSYLHSEIGKSDNTEEELSDDAWLYSHGISFWRPWLTEDWFSVMKSHLDLSVQEGDITRDTIVICPPVPWANAGYFVIYKDTSSDKIAPSDPCPAVYISAVTRSFYDLAYALQIRGEEQWKAFDGSLSPYFDRHGPYLITKISREKYEDFFRHCLTVGIVIAPSCLTPSIVPYGVSPGDFRKLDRNPFVF